MIRVSDNRLVHWLAGAVGVLILCVSSLGWAQTDSKRPNDIPAGYNSTATDADLTEIKTKEFVVDEEGEIYRERGYSGIIPKHRDRLDEGVGTDRQAGKNPVIRWVGFQHRTLLSTVFIQTDQDLSSFRVYKPDPTHIYVDIPRANVPVRNQRRELATDAFDSPVEGIHARPISVRGFKGTRLIITLNRPAGYMWRQDGLYVYVDIAR